MATNSRERVAFGDGVAPVQADEVVDEAVVGALAVRLRKATAGRRGRSRARSPTVDGRNPFRAALKPWLKPQRLLVFAGESHDSRDS